MEFPMKYIIGLAILASPLSINAQERLFDLSDLEAKLGAGITVDQYCEGKADISLKQVQAAGAPVEAQQQIKQWVAISCGMDVMAEGLRAAAKKP